MKVLLLSTDLQVFNEGSAVRERIKEYGSLVDELHIIVYANRGSRIKNQELSKNVFAYPTNTWFKPFYFFNAYYIAKRVIHDSRFTIHDSLVTTQDPFETGLVGWIIKRRFGLSLQLQAHTDFLSPYFWQASLKNKLRVLLAKWLVKKADGLRVVSERIKNSLLTLHPKTYTPKPIQVLPIFVDLEKFRNVLLSDELSRKYGDDFIILTVARLEPEKNLALAIDAVANIMWKHYRVRYVIIGVGSLKKMLAEKIQRLRLENRIEIKQVSSEDLPAWHKRANLFLLTSNFEGYGMAAVEAAAARVPVVMTDVGVALGKVVPVKDRAAIIAAINELIDRPEIRKEIIEKQNYLLKDWPTKSDYLSAIKKSWQAIFTEAKR